MKRRPSEAQGSLREVELIDTLQFVRNCVRTLLEYCRSQWGEEDVPYNVARHALVEIDRVAPELVKTDFKGYEEQPFSEMAEGGAK